jgi:hypothetical protein
MNRHQRRKLSRVRKEAKASKLLSRAIMVLREETQKRNLAHKRPNRFERSGSLGNRGIYSGLGLYPAPGYGTGAFKEKPLGERALRELRSRD